MRTRTATSLAIAAIVAFAAIDTDPGFARGGGGGFRGGGGGGFSRGGGGFSGGGIRSSASTSISRPSYGSTGARAGGFNTAGVNRANIAGGDRNISGSGNRINTGDVNINTGNGWNGGWGGWSDHPVASGVVAGTVAGATAAAVAGSTYYALPPGCPAYPYGGYSYYSCGGVYYQPQYEGDTVTYVTVPDPSKQASASP